ncbi:MAG: ribonuclease III [Natronospirillum sp.]|uniref:ribonuclease III n=1 Tax=Natronospirillum sp. TaxID=2812955 RepID=UPI0025FBD4D6|nr:ribonuclease III [Natronospirillum sp.]MCH8550487.1 ribonuclease III [Natronospirillum sp.]
MNTNDFARIQQRLGYEFNDRGLLLQALTHRSHGVDNNERLEFLGDAILNCTIAQALFEQFPKASEGELSRYRAAQVRGETLADIAREFDLGPWLRLGPGELKSGGHRRASILADTVEALIGAISLDGGMAIAQARVLAWWQSRLENTDPEQMMKDPKTRLQEYQQGQGSPLPRYEVVDISGQAHNQTFTVSCTVDQLADSVLASDTSRRGAEQAAARKTLRQLGQQT